MKVSVIIPTFNSGRLVVQAIDSALAQTHAAAQIVVVDDGSTDDTCDRIRPYLDRLEYVQQPNRRVAAARNAGLARVTGELIAFLDADDAWHPHKLARQVDVLAQRPEIGVLATGLTDWPGPLAAELPPAPGTIAAVRLVEMLLFNPLATSSVVIRRELLERVGRFDTELFGPEDYDLWLRCAQQSQVAILREPLTGYRDTCGSLGKQAETMRQGLLRIHAKLDAAGVWPNPWLRRKCRAHLDYTTGYMFFAGGKARQATRLLLQSLAGYPWPLSPPDVRCHWARVRLLFRSLTSRKQVPS
ncbi:MAG TPA: glycosyltransferase family A protein [Pirellulaceae bacterium]|nr:glycosyltransferase family A protein [Pirellulaceae bacterium]